MFRNRLLKILALLMVLNILMVPLTSFTPQQQNKYKVYASGQVVEMQFFAALLALIGVTAVQLGSMSPSFSIPEVDMVALKDQFQSTLETDMARREAFMTARTEYLAGGISKTMGAVELAKIGINDIYNSFLGYLSGKLSEISDTTVISGDYQITTDIINSSLMHHVSFFKTANTYSSPFFISNALSSYQESKWIVKKSIIKTSDNTTVASVLLFVDAFNVKANASIFEGITGSNPYLQDFINICNYYNIDYKLKYPELTSGYINGSVNYDSGGILDSTADTLNIFPTIPWLDPALPIGTVVTPAIAAPYAGAVPIDVPITVPIDPPIDEPVDPPVEPTLLGTVAAILAGILPISGILDNILAGISDITGSIAAGLTDVIDSIGDIAGTLTGGITSTLSDIQTSISSLLDPPTETLNTEKLKNLNSVLFTKFPFSIPFDFIDIISAIDADPVAPVLSIPFNMENFGGTNSNVEIDLSIYDNYANIARQIAFIGFVIFMLFNTRKLIWK